MEPASAASWRVRRGRNAATARTLKRDSCIRNTELGTGGWTAVSGRSWFQLSGEQLPTSNSSKTWLLPATGNAGQSVVETLPKLLDPSKALSSHRVLAPTRSSKSPAAQQLAMLAGVELAEKNWLDITADCLSEQEVVRVLISSHDEPSTSPTD